MASEMRAILKDFAEADTEKESAFAQETNAVSLMLILLLLIKRLFMAFGSFLCFLELSISLTGKRGKVKREKRILIYKVFNIRCQNYLICTKEYAFNGIIGL